jgi:hypothetical protein
VLVAGALLGAGPLGIGALGIGVLGIGALGIGALGIGPLRVGPAAAEPKSMPDGARVYIIWPADGQVISGGKFWVRMGLSAGGVAPAGTEKQWTGHHHLIVDADLPPFDEEIPNDKHHLHYGLGQTEARLELPPGRHTLQMLFADDAHLPHKPPLYSAKITIIVPP